jgi:hypothetical protein
VLLSKKILFSLAAVPILWVSYAVLALLFTSLETRTIVVLFLCCPLFSYIGVMAVEASIVDLKDLRPAFLRLLPGFKQHSEALPAQRAAIQKELRALVEKYGPSFGPLYTEKTEAWEVAHFGLSPESVSTANNASTNSAGPEPPTNHDQIASAIATTFCDDDETAIDKQANKKKEE